MSVSGDLEVLREKKRNIFATRGLVARARLTASAGVGRLGVVARKRMEEKYIVKLPPRKKRNKIDSEDWIPVRCCVCEFSLGGYS